jgi:outer membrane murein-binding lipoprotein Lpp
VVPLNFRGDGGAHGRCGSGYDGRIVASRKIIMRAPLACLAVIAAALSAAGCSTVPPTAWNFDPTQPQPKPAMASDEAVAINNRIAQLQIAKNDVRAQISAHPDAAARLALYARLHDIGSELAPLERRVQMYTAAR